MRVISGKFKGRNLSSFDEDHLRPMTDRVKGSLFNIWGPFIEGSRVLDLFSGTGSIGIEALSRGAQSVDMVENNKRSIQIIQKNLGLLGVKDEVVIHREEVIHFIDNYSDGAFDLIFIDPPFPSKICHKTLQALSTSTALSADSRVVIEHSKHEPLDDIIDSLSRVDTRDYGDKILSFYRKGG